MDDLAGHIMMSMSETLLQQSSTFRDSLSKFLLNRNLNDPNYVDPLLITSIVDELFRDMPEKPPNLMKQRANDLIAIFNQPDWLTLTRVFQAMHTLQIRYPLDQQRLSMYLKQLKFTNNYRIDLKEFSIAMCNKYDPAEITVFGQLDKSQKNIIEVLNQQQMEALADLPSESVGFLSKIMRISAEQRNLILSFTEAEIHMYHYMKPWRIREMLNSDAHHLDALFGANPGNYNELRTTYSSNPKFLACIRKVIDFSPERMLRLKNLLEHPSTRGINEEGGTFLEGIDDIEDAGIRKFKLKNDQQKNVIGDLSEEMRNALVIFDENDHGITLRSVLRRALKFGAKKKDLIALLTPDQLDSILEGTGDENLFDIAHLNGDLRAHMMKLGYFRPEEEHELFININQDQKRVLARLYVLCPDGLDIIRELGPVRTYATLTRIRHRELWNFNIREEILTKRIQRLSMNERIQILNLTLEELIIFNRIFDLEPNSIKYLTELSKEGIIVLESVKDFETKQIQFVLKQSTRGITVLAENGQLNPTIIESLRPLDRTKSRFLINLNQRQREYLSTHSTEHCVVGDLFSEEDIDTLRSLTGPQERGLLSTISTLTEQEKAQLRRIDELEALIILNLDPSISRLVFSLSKNELHEISGIFDWRTEERFAFGLWESLLEPDPTDLSINDFLGMMESHVLGGNRAECSKFIAGVVRAYRSARPQDSTILEEMITTADEVYEHHTVDLCVYLLNYSIEDNVELSELEYLFSKIPGTVYSEGKLRELCDIANGDVPFLFRWMLVNPIVRYQELSDRIIRNILTAHVSNPNLKTLKAILQNYRGIQRSDVAKSLRKQLTANDFALTHTLFFNQQQDFEKWESIAKWLSNVLNTEEQFEFLNSPFNHEGGGNFDVLEYSLFHDKGCSYPFFERLNADQLKRLFDKHPVSILRAIARNGHFRTLEIFSKNIKKEKLIEVIRNNRQKIFISNVEGFVFGNYRLEDLTRTVQWFAMEDPYPSFYNPIQTQLALQAQDENIRGFDQIIDVLGIDQINRDEIIEEVREQRPPQNYDGPICPQRARNERSLFPACFDSTKNEDMSSEESEHLMRSVFGNIQTEHNDLYESMTSVPNDVDLEKLCEKIANMQLDAVDPEIRDILLDMKKVASNRGKVAEILSGSSAAAKIQKVAERAGLAFTIFLILKHAIQLDLKSWGFDALNLWALPKLGSKVSEKLLAMSERVGLPALKVIGPVLGRFIGNFGAYLGLMDSIEAKKNAQDPLSIEIANLNIFTNAVFILADIPALVTDVLGFFEIATGIIGEFAGPIGLGVSVCVIVISECIQAALELNNISKKIQLTLWEKTKFYFESVFGGELPDILSRDATAKSIYNSYISEIIDQYKHDYGMIGISLPSIFVTTGEYCKKLGFIMGVLLPHHCKIHNNRIGINYDFSLGSVTVDLSSKLHYYHFSKSLPANVHSFNLVCGPREDDVRTYITGSVWIASLAVASEQAKRTGREILMKNITERWFIPQQNNSACDNIVLYKNQTKEASQKMFFSLRQNASIKISKAQSMDMIFSGSNLSLMDYGIVATPLPRSEFYFLQEVIDCILYKAEINFIFIKYEGTFACDLGEEYRHQSNVAMVQGNFTDIKNIHRIIGSEDSDRINVSHSAHVDGRGGNDTINAQNSTIVKSYYGDVIHGKTMTQLPMNVSEIHKVVADKFIKVYNGDNQSIQVDAGSELRTNDEFLIYPIETDNVTHVVTHLYVHKNVDGDIVLEDELDVLKRMETTRFNCSMQITSQNYDITLSDINHSIFHADRNHHNFYWVAEDGRNHLYVFEFITANVTISKAQGILDFSQFYHVFEDIEENLIIVEQREGPLSIDIGSLRVNLLADRQPIKITFDGENYFHIKNGRLERDYCLYSFKIDGRLIVDGQELFDHHNCFEFPSDKIIFSKQNRNLLLSYGRNVLIVTNFYPLVHENLDISLKLNSRVIRPKEFRKRARNPNQFRFYEIIEPGLTIYHNLPIDKNQIGVIYTNQSSILDHDINLQGDDLFLINRNGIPVTIVDWKKYQAAREVMFAFNDTLIFNAQCVLSNCTPGYTLEEFRRQKELAKLSVIRRKCHAHLDSLEITGNETGNNNNTCSAFKENVNLVILLVQKYLGHKYPLPQFPSINPEEICAYATNITQSFQQKLEETNETLGTPLKNFDCFELYSNITEHLRNEEYSKASMILNSVVEEMFQSPV